MVLPATPSRRGTRPSGSAPGTRDTTEFCTLDQDPSIFCSSAAKDGRSDVSKGVQQQTVSHDTSAPPLSPSAGALSPTPVRHFGHIILSIRSAHVWGLGAFSKSAGGAESFPDPSPWPLTPRCPFASASWAIIVPNQTSPMLRASHEPDVGPMRELRTGLAIPAIPVPAELLAWFSTVDTHRTCFLPRIQSPAVVLPVPQPPSKP